MHHHSLLYTCDPLTSHPPQIDGYKEATVGVHDLVNSYLGKATTKIERPQQMLGLEFRVTDDVQR